MYGVLGSHTYAVMSCEGVAMRAHLIQNVHSLSKYYCMPAPAPSSPIKPANYMPPPSSHAWLGTVGKLLDTVFGFLSSASEDTRVWIDCVAINQHDKTNAAQNKADVSAFEDVLQLCGGGTIVVVDMASGTNPASRGWCLYEWDHTLHYHGPDGLHMTVRGRRGG